MLIFNLILFVMSWKIKAEIDDSIRAAEEEDEEDWKVISTVPPLGVDDANSPMHPPSDMDLEARESRLSSADSTRSRSRESLTGRMSSTGGHRRSFADILVPEPVTDDPQGVRINSISVI